MQESTNPLGPPPSLDSYATSHSIKEDLPLEWVLGQLWGLWNLGSHKVSCPSPTHSDSTPSFNLWKPDASGRYTKFGCYGCSLRGDVIDAVQIHYEVGYVEALEIASSKLLPEYQKSGFLPQQDTRERIPVEAVRRSYDELLEYELDLPTVVRFLNMMDMMDVLSYVDQWKVHGHKLIHAVGFPHYNPSGELTGVKFRDPVKRSKKWGIRGSQFPWLYGAWRDLGRQHVVLCEGESDTIWAAHQLRERNCDVLGLPTGALQIPTAHQLEQLEGRVVWLVFDGDDAGKAATATWMDRLARGHIVEVPRNHDLVSCGISMHDLLGLKGGPNGS